MYFAHSVRIMSLGEETLLLTPNQRGGLLRTRKMSNAARRQNDKVCRDKLELYLQSASDALLILERLPELIEHLKKEDRERALNPERIELMLKVVEKFLELANPGPIVENNANIVGKSVFRTAIVRNERGLDLMTFYRTATPEDVARQKVVKNHITAIEHHINPYVRDPIVRDVEYFQKFREDAEKRDLSYGAAWHFIGCKREDGSIDTDLLEHSPDLTEVDFPRAVNPPGLPTRIEED